MEDDAHATWTARHIVVTFESQGDGTLVQISERFVNTASRLMTLGPTVGMTGSALLGIAVFAAVGKGLLGGFLALPVIALVTVIGLMLGRARTLTAIANAEDSFERALASLSAPGVPAQSRAAAGGW